MSFFSGNSFPGGGYARARRDAALAYGEEADIEDSALDGKDYFVITTNVDHQFQLAGFDKQRLFYTQGDYGLLQCAQNCSGKTYDNEELVRQMIAKQHDMKIPEGLAPTCPNCGAPMVPNLRIDERFCEDEGWHEAARRYQEFREVHATGKVLYLELGVGDNTPAIIKYPFWDAVKKNPDATYTCVNMSDACAPNVIANRSILIDGDMRDVLGDTLRPIAVTQTRDCDRRLSCGQS